MNNFLLSIGEAYVGLLLLRFYATLVNTPFYMPPMQFLVAISEPLVHPFRRIIRNRGLWDVALVAVIVVLEALLLSLAFWNLLTAASLNFAALFLYILLRLLKISIFLLLLIVIAEAILSWINPQAPVTPFLNRLSHPFLGPLRQVIPPIGGIDITPIILFLLIELFLRFILTPLIARAYWMVLGYAVSLP
jgi:YggT family protein